MTIIWIVVGLTVLAAVGWWLEWREKNQGEALKQYVLETAELERRLALMNPRLARGERLLPDEWSWLEKMLVEHRITSDPTKWARPDLGYDAISGMPLEFFNGALESGGSKELMELKWEQVRNDKMQRMIADIGMPQTQQQMDEWWASHSADENRPKRNDPVLPGKQIYHAMAIRQPLSPALYGPT